MIYLLASVGCPLSLAWSKHRQLTQHFVRHHLALHVIHHRSYSEEKSMKTEQLCKGIAIIAGSVTAALWVMSFEGDIR